MAYFARDPGHSDESETDSDRSSNVCSLLTGTGLKYQEKKYIM